MKTGFLATKLGLGFWRPSSLREKEGWWPSLEKPFDSHFCFSFNTTLPPCLFNASVLTNNTRTGWCLQGSLVECLLIYSAHRIVSRKVPSLPSYGRSLLRKAKPILPRCSDCTVPIKGNPGDHSIPEEERRPLNKQTSDRNSSSPDCFLVPLLLASDLSHLHT